MTMQVASIIVKKSRGHMVVAAIGRTNTGQSYIKGTRALAAKSAADPKFKSQLKAAVEELLDSKA